MGYTHYWYRKQGAVSPLTYNLIKSDFKKLIPVLENLGVHLADGNGEGTPFFDSENVIFNGVAKCGHAKNSEITIPWPSENAAGVVKGYDGNEPSGHWFAGALIDKRCCDGCCSYETFSFPRVAVQADYRKDEELVFDFTKTAYRPYDLAVNCFLIIAKHYLKGDIKVASDGEDWNWAEGRVICQENLGYGVDFELRSGEDE